jgi:hypothetical protein
VWIRGIRDEVWGNSTQAAMEAVRLLPVRKCP